MRALLAFLMMLSAHAAQAADGSYAFYGYAYDLATGKYLFTEAHRQTVTGGRWQSGVITYYAPDGSQYGQKSLDFSNDPYVPVYRMDIGPQHYREAITANRTEVRMIRRSAPGRPEESARIAKAPGLVADAGIHPFLVDHLPELMAGQTIPFRFVVAGNLDAYRFSASRIADVQREGKTFARFTLKPSSMLSLLVDPLEVIYDVSQKRLLEFRGFSTTYDRIGGKTYNVRIVYSDQPPADAPKNLPPLP